MFSDSVDSRPVKLQGKTAEPLPCPRCHSTITKFCYYNNYNLSQPRYFCKSCRRYWTHGGTLRNVPIGGGSRKTSSASVSKRVRSSASSSSASSSTCSSNLTTLMVSDGTVPVQTGPNEPVQIKGTVNGSFTASVLANQNDGAFLASNGSESGLGFGYGFDETGLELDGYNGIAASGGDTWQNLYEFEGDSGGDGYIWPGLDLEFSVHNKNL